MLSNNKYYVLRFKSQNYLYLINYDKATCNHYLFILLFLTPFIFRFSFLFHSFPQLITVAAKDLINSQRYHCGINSVMEALKAENQQLKRAVEQVLEEIQQQKELNQQHEAEIETLLKFNERLLSIIQNQLNNKKDNYTLQPISQRSERDSDLIGPTINSLIKSRRLAARSERGPSTTNSLVGPKSPKVVALQKERQKSEIDHSFDNEDLSQQRLQQKTAIQIISKGPLEGLGKKMADIERKVENSSAVREELSKEIDGLKKFKKESIKFYDKKISEIKGLSSKLNTYKPMEQLKKISQKLTLSPGTSELIRKTMEKNLSK